MADLKEFAEQLVNLTVKEVKELADILKDEYGIEPAAAAAVAVAGPAGGGEGGGEAEKTEFVNTINNHTMVHERLRSFYQGFRLDAHPMAVMCGVVGALSAFYHDSLDIDDQAHRTITAHRLIAKIPTIAAMV
ncbi:MAG: hypothetical protein MI922_11385, partial [Bacteroidales bacterium]|nr:hypothetical protein [Bacteroidales bacterium]